MAEKKIFTSLVFQSGAKLVAPKVEIITPETNLTQPASNNNYYTGSAGQLAYNNGNIWVNNDSIWTKLLNHATTATISGDFTFDRVDSNSNGAAPFFIGSNSTNKLVAGLNADKLDGYDARNALNDGTTHSIPRRDDNNLFHVGTPTEDTHVVNKKYADTIAQGLSIKTAVRCATTSNVSVATDLNVGDTIDGVTLADGDRVLVKDQSSSYTHNNGVWIAGASPARATDYDSASEINDGDFFFVQEGTTNGNKGFVQTKNVSELGSGNEIAFEQFSEAGNLEVYSQAGTAAASKTAGPLVQVGNDVTFGYNDTHFAVDTNGNLKLASGGSGTGISSALLQDDAVTAAKLDDDGDFTMGGLTVNGGTTVNGALFHSKGANTTATTFATSASNAKIRFQNHSSSSLSSFEGVITSDSTAWYKQVANSGGSSAYNLHLNPFGGDVAIGTEGIDPSGTLHVSTARYGSEEVTDGTFPNFDNWTAASSFSVANNTASCDGSQSGYVNLLQGGVFTGGRKYRLKMETTRSAGSFKVWAGSPAVLLVGPISSTQNIDQVVTPTNSGNLQIEVDPDFVGTFKNVSVTEDNLASGVESDANDLVVNGNSKTGISIISRAAQDAALYFGDGLDNDFSSIASVRALDGTGTLKLSVNGSAALELDSSQNAKFYGGVGINGVTAGTDAVLRIRNKNDTSHWPLVVENANGNKSLIVSQTSAGHGILFLRQNADASNYVRLDASGTSYFHGGNVAIGDTAASAKLEVITTSNTDGIQIRRASANVTATALLGFRTSSGANATNTSSIAAVRTNLPNAGDNKLVFQTQASGALAEHLTIDGYGTHDHKANSIVNSATVAGLQDGACYDFDGTDDSVSFTTPAPFSGNGLNSFDATLSAWAKFNSIGQYEAIVCLGAFDFEIAPLNPNNNEVGIWINDAVWTGDNFTPTVGEWNHYVATKDGNSYSLYVDGVLIGTATDADNGTVATTSYVGRNGSSGYFDGQIRDVKIFPSALDAGDIRKLYSGENPKKNLNVDTFSSLAQVDSEWSISGRTASTSGANFKRFTLNVSPGIETEQHLIKLTVSGYSGSGYLEADTLTSVARYNSSGSSVGTTAFGSGNGVWYYILKGSATAVTAFSVYGKNTFVGSVEVTSVEKIETLVDFTPQSASSTQWRNEAIPSLYHGTVNNATLSQGNSYWNNIKQNGQAVELSDTFEVTGANEKINLKLGAPHSTITQRGWLQLENASNNTTVYTNAGASNGEYGIHTFKQSKGDGTDARSILTLGETASTNVQVHGKLGVGGAADSTHHLYVNGSSKFASSLYLANATAANINAVTGHMGLYFDSDSNANVADRSFTIYNRAAAALKIDGNSNVAIGSTDPASLLDLTGVTESSNTDTPTNQFLTFAATNYSNSVLEGSGLVWKAKYTNYTKNSAEIRFIGEGNYFRGGIGFYTNGVSDNSTAASEVLRLKSDGTQDHKANRIVNSQTVNDSWRSSEPSLRFDGSDDYVDITGSFDFGGVSNFSVSAWFKANDLSTQFARIFYDNRPNNANSYRVSLSIDSGSIDGFVNTSSGGAGNTVTQSNAGFVAGKWYHAVLTYNGVHQKLYLNGTEIGSTAQTGAIVDTGTGDYTGTAIGCRKDNNQDQFFNGEIKDVRIHNRALKQGVYSEGGSNVTYNEVQALYNGESTPYKYADADPSFFYNTSGSYTYWTGGGNHSASVSSNILIVTASGASNGSSNAVTITASNVGTFVTGKTYKWQFQAKLGSGTTSATLRARTPFDHSDVTTGSYKDFVLTSDWVTYEIIGTQIAVENAYFGIIAANAYNANVDIQNIKASEAGEVAAYTPKSIGGGNTGSWFDTTSNRNHGAVSGATVVNPLKLGPMQIGGDYPDTVNIRYDAADSVPLQLNNRNKTNGDTTAVRWLHEDGNSTGGYYPVELGTEIANANDRKADFKLWVSDTDNVNRANDCRFHVTHGGDVKATSGASTNLKQVARVSNHVLNGDGSATSFTFTHNLGTADIVVSVRTRSAPYEQVECHVLCNGDATTTANDPTNKCTIVFATAPPSGSAGEYKVAVVG